MLETHKLVDFGEDGRRQIPKIRPIRSWESRIWDHSVPEHMKWTFGKILKLRSQETKNKQPRNQETFLFSSPGIPSTPQQTDSQCIKLLSYKAIELPDYQAIRASTYEYLSFGIFGTKAKQPNVNVFKDEWDSAIVSVRIRFCVMFRLRHDLR